MVVGGVLANLILNIPAGGSIETPPSLEAEPANIAMGKLYQGNNYTYPVTLTNTGSTATAPLAFTTSTLPTGMTITWDSAGQVIAGHASKIVTFTVTISPTAPEVSSFSINIAVSA
jgi:hypothetical protein